MKHKERLDVLLVVRGLAESRSRAQAVIMAAWMSRLKPRSRCAGTCARM